MFAFPGQRSRALCRIVLCSSIAATVSAQALGSLKQVPVPSPAGLERYVRDSDALVVLGKALFWDMQVGSDSRTACATCHFHAGADHRRRNQLSNPAGLPEPNHTLLPEDFPFLVFADVADNHSAVRRDSTQRTGSAGVVHRRFIAVSARPGEGDEATDIPDAAGFRTTGGLNLRQVTPRNTPSVINAVFDVRTFWDGRASNVFTGRTPFGDSDPAANLLAAGSDGQVIRERLRLVNSSLASLAVAPPLNTTEMAYEGRSWSAVAKKLLPARPLVMQKVAADDSVLGSRLGASDTYLSLIRTAFQPAYVDATVVENNFPVFFGLAVQAYLSKLVSDDSRLDQFADGNRAALTAEETAGLLVFQTRAFCMSCHSGPELTSASYTALAARGPVDEVVTGTPADAKVLFSDTGFVHTGVRPASEDSGLNGRDDFAVPFSRATAAGGRELAIAGAFKAPSLRNVEFTGPYFHNGGEANLEQVIDFYARGGDHPASPGLPSMMMPLTLTAQERTQLIAFLKALSDDRVRFERAPFDHPELCVPVGYPDSPEPDAAFPGSAKDQWAGIPAVGRNGNATPLQSFEELLRGIGGNEETRAHTLTGACTIPAISGSAP